MSVCQLKPELMKAAVIAWHDKGDSNNKEGHVLDKRVK